MGVRLVPKSVTLNDRKQRTGCVVCVISLNSVAFMANYVKVADIASNRFSPEKCHKVHQLSTTDVLCSS